MDRERAKAVCLLAFVVLRTDARSTHGCSLDIVVVCLCASAIFRAWHVHPERNNLYCMLMKLFGYK